MTLFTYLSYDEPVSRQPGPLTDVFCLALGTPTQYTHRRKQRARQSKPKVSRLRKAHSVLSLLSNLRVEYLGHRHLKGTSGPTQQKLALGSPSGRLPKRAPFQYHPRIKVPLVEL